MKKRNLCIFIGALMCILVLVVLCLIFYNDKEKYKELAEEYEEELEKELTEINPFDCIEVKFEGESGDGEVIIEKNEYALNTLDFWVRHDANLCNGDIVIIEVDIDSIYEGVKQGYKYTMLEKEYKVSGLENINRVKQILNTDLDLYYPEDACDVVKFYTDIQMCYYNEEYTEEELLGLVDQSMRLFSEELIEVNPLDKYVSSLKDDICNYEKEEKTIKQVIVCEDDEVQYTEIEGIKYVKLKCNYLLMQKDEEKEIIQEFMLRQNSGGEWKIVGWMGK